MIEASDFTKKLGESMRDDADQYNANTAYMSQVVGETNQQVGFARDQKDLAKKA